MRRKVMNKVLIGLVAVSALAAQASAACHKKATLRGTGFAPETSGEVDVRSSDNVQRFKLSMDAKVADGTTYVLYVNGLAAGTVTFLLNAGEVEFNNSNRGVMPNRAEACSLSTIELRDASNQPVALGSF